MALRELLVSLGFEMDKGQEKSVLNSIGIIKKAALGLGVAFSVKAIAGFVSGIVNEVAEAGDNLDELAQKIGVNAQALQELGPIAEKNGASMGELANSLKILSKNAFDAKGGSKELRSNFSKLGVSVTNANGELKGSEELFTEIADGLSNIKNPAEQVALAQKVLGKSGNQLLPVLLKGSKAIEEQRKRAHELGVVYDGDLLAASSAYTDAQKDQASAIKGLKATFAKELLPIMTKGAEALTRFIVQARPVATFLGRTLSGIISSTSKNFRFLWDAFAKTSAAFKALAVAGAVAMFIIFAPGLAMAALIALIGVAVIALIDDFLAWKRGAQSVIGTIIKGFEELVDEMGGIGPALLEMLKVAGNFWLDFFGLGKKEFDAFIENTFGRFFGLGKRGSFFGLAQAPGTIDQAGKQSGFFGVGTTGGMTPAFAGAGGMSIAPTSNVEVNINASGSNATASDIASQTAQQVTQAQSRSYSEAVRAFSVAK